MPKPWQMPPSKWGAGDQRGSGNLMKAETVLRAAKLIKTGEVFERGAVLSPYPKEALLTAVGFSIFTPSPRYRRPTRVAGTKNWL